MLDILWGKFDFSVKQFGQHSGAQGNGERKQLQLYDKHYPATKHTQLCILGAYFTSVILF